MMSEYIFSVKQKNKTKLKTKASNIKVAKENIVKRCFLSVNGLNADDFSIELDHVLLTTKKERN
tara:strand:+ start:2130 stop:2321 length:192 start_codon:yes stop_codon:yes gene_type:complete